uniref:Uncharacterized protein n=1 Tax=Pithovirus LCDPAC01 TaxID=2506600 RepID=A0A4D5XFL2_9VIRU|nr:MAG: hypothetical protein LCDPAC01_02530 [Pithovirus LCDPAC01]
MRSPSWYEESMDGKEDSFPDEDFHYTITNKKGIQLRNVVERLQTKKF